MTSLCYPTDDPIYLQARPSIERLELPLELSVRRAQRELDIRRRRAVREDGAQDLEPTTERELIGKYPTLTARQIQKIFEAKGFVRSVYAISDARTRFGYRSHSEQSRRRNADARSVFKDCETIKDFDFNKLYTRSPCLQCQLREQDKDNYTCGECGFRYHYAQQQHTRWGEDYGQATREIWDTMQYGFVEPNIAQYVS